MTTTTNTTAPALTLYPLAKLAKELNACSPELRALLRMALAGANGEPVTYPERERAMAAMRLNEAVTRRTADVMARRAT